MNRTLNVSINYSGFCETGPRSRALFRNFYHNKYVTIKLSRMKPLLLAPQNEHTTASMFCGVKGPLLINTINQPNQSANFDEFVFLIMPVDTYFLSVLIFEAKSLTFWLRFVFSRIAIFSLYR